MTGERTRASLAIARTYRKTSRALFRIGDFRDSIQNYVRYLSDQSKRTTEIGYRPDSRLPKMWKYGPGETA